MDEDKNIRCPTGGGRRHIAAELIWDILSRLPILALYRAQTVCKAWHTIITSPDFIQTINRSRSSRKPSLGLLVSAKDLSTCELLFYYTRLDEKNSNTKRDQGKVPPQFVCRSRFSFSDYSGATQVVNGVVCLFSKNRVSLFNICTREIIHLPEPPIHHPKSFSHYSKSLSYYYLGFDTSHNVFKLLRQSQVWIQLNHYVFKYEILTITTPIYSCKWRRLEQSLPNTGIFSTSVPKWVWGNGRLYWTLCSDLSLVVYVFDLDNEMFHTYFLREFFDKHTIMQIGPSSVGTIQVFSSYNRRLLKIYSLSDSNPPAWVRDIIELPAELCGRVTQAAGTLPNGDILLANENVRNCNFTPVYSYNYETKSFRRFAVGKFPRPKFSILENMEKTPSCITCIEEDLTPLQDLLGIGNGDGLSAEIK